MDLPAWGIAVIALYSLLQIPAVLFVARYCEVDAEELPTPPMRAYWREGEANGESPEAPTPEAGVDPRTDSATERGPTPAPPGKASVPRSEGATPPFQGVDRATGVRCASCGTANDPSFARCRRCVEPL